MLTCYFSPSDTEVWARRQLNTHCVSCLEQLCRSTGCDSSPSPQWTHRNDSEHLSLRFLGWLLAIEEVFKGINTSPRSCWPQEDPRAHPDQAWYLGKAPGYNCFQRKCLASLPCMCIYVHAHVLMWLCMCVYVSPYVFVSSQGLFSLFSPFPAAGEFGRPHHDFPYTYWPYVTILPEWRYCCTGTLLCWKLHTKVAGSSSKSLYFYNFIEWQRKPGPKRLLSTISSVCKWGN